MDEAWISKLKTSILKPGFSQSDFTNAITIKTINIPPKLFKYRSVGDYALDNLSNDTLHCALASTFNDPYDCALTFDTEFGRKYELEIARNSCGFPESVIQEIEHSAEPFYSLVDNIRKTNPKMTNAEKKQLNKLIKNHEQRKNRILKQFNDEIRTHCKICSLSQRIDSLLMWGHYASCHTGFAMEYDFSGTPNVHHIAGYLWPVLYEKKIYDGSHILNSLSPNNPPPGFWLGMLSALHKSDEWQYEKEWRIIIPESLEANPRQNFFVGKPTAVYLGAKISDEDATIVSFIAKTKHIPVYRMHLSPTEFRMGYKKIKA